MTSAQEKFLIGKKSGVLVPEVAHVCVYIVEEFTLVSDTRQPSVGHG